MSWSQFANLISTEDRNLESWRAAIEGNPNLPDAALKVAIMHFVQCKDVSAVEFLSSFVVDLVRRSPTSLAVDGACAHEWDGGYPNDDNLYCIHCGATRPATKA